MIVDSNNISKRIDADWIVPHFEKMAELGFEFTHFGEFAWGFLEPSDGKFEFAWLDRAVDLAARNGLKVILCTVPTNLRDCAPFGALHRADLTAARGGDTV
jgi:beta-galactosidase GanA